ncbi:MAG: UvrD-helicase domain-containing protein [Treponema sp.]|nr:UvrD-helicase domain-containing protein [Treponema sp.]
MDSENLDFLQELDDGQRAAAVVEKNAVVSAGAGSGKTSVLAARYGWLIMTGRCTVDQILTITFTNKAANEMYRRIYDLLSIHAPSNEYAREAVKNFYQARISTLDSFCMTIARTVCRHYGISPGFESNDVRLKELARSLALRFVLDKRNNPSLQRLIAEKKMRSTADELFVRPILYHSTVSSPLDFAGFEKIQREEIVRCWKDLVLRAEEQITLIREQQERIPLESKLYEHLNSVLLRVVKAPEIETLLTGMENTGSIKKGIVLYIEFLSDLKKFRFYSRKETEAALIIREAMGELKNLYGYMEALANQILQWKIVQEVFPLISEYQDLLSRKKREAGILSFNDIAHLAVDGLRQHGDIRRMYQAMFRMIMIDEFQDNNNLQRDLVDLLAGPAKVYYVGDEKQSIYRFRGADVSVFRNLAEQTESKLSLNRNYRSHPSLILAFNRIFGGYRHEGDPDPLEGIFPPEGTKTKAYQAAYCWIKNRETPDKDNNGKVPHLHFAFFDKGRLEPSSLSAEDHEAAYIAGTIKNMHNQENMAYGGFAVLLRSHTHQSSLERAFKLHGIPFSTDRPAALFNDAPINDLWAFLKLLVYPGDAIAYGALLRSPFVRLSEDAFILCMLQGGKIFDEALDEKLTPQDRRRYRNARHRYLEFLHDARDLPVSSLITRLWYGEGYRCEALWPAASQVYLDLYDLFFEQARTIEERGGGLVDFLDYLEDLANRQEKPDDSTLPGEEEGGVRIMTIHHAKGLEFSVVFVYGCGGREKTSLDQGLALFSERRGVYLHLPQSEELPNAKNYFFLEEKKDNQDKTEAELRRLLYVAMTRAKQKLFVTAVIPPQNKEERESINPEQYGGYEKEFIVARLEQYRIKPKVQSLSFLRILPGLSGDNPLYTVEAIGVSGVQKETTVKLTLEEAALQAAVDYKTIPVVPPCRSVPQAISASSLQAGDPVFREYSAASVSQDEFNFGGPSETLDELLTQTGTGPQEFGVIVHSFIEAIFNGEKPRLPPRFAGEKKQEALASMAQSLAERFFNSPLGRSAVSADFRKTEYPVLTAVEGPQNRIIVTGKIDLLFDDGNTVFVIDFKTDREEDIARHAGQLAIYKRAAEDIFGKPVECRLFYLRNGREADMGGEVSKTSPEELIAAWESSLGKTLSKTT